MHESIDHITDPKTLADMLLRSSCSTEAPERLDFPKHPIRFSTPEAADEHYGIRLRAAQTEARIRITREAKMRRERLNGHRPIPEAKIEADPAVFRAFTNAVMKHTTDRPETQALLGVIGSLAEQARQPFHINPEIIDTMLAMAQGPTSDASQTASVTDITGLVREYSEYPRISEVG
jgi:hypothetical protein